MISKIDLHTHFNSVRTGTFIGAFLNLLEGQSNSPILLVDRGDRTIYGVSSAIKSHRPYYSWLKSYIESHREADLTDPMLINFLSDFYFGFYISGDKMLSSLDDYSSLWLFLSLKIWGIPYKTFKNLYTKEVLVASGLESADSRTRIHYVLSAMVKDGSLVKWIKDERQRFVNLGYSTILHGLTNRIFKSLASVMTCSELSRLSILCGLPHNYIDLVTCQIIYNTMQGFYK